MTLRAISDSEQTNSREAAQTVLLAIAMGIVKNSTAPDSMDFDVAKWLCKWLELPQPALGGRSAEELLDTPAGLEVVTRLLGALESGAFQ